MMLFIPAFICALCLNLKNQSYKLTGILFTLVICLSGFIIYYDFNKKNNPVPGDYYFAIINEYPVRKTNSFKSEATLTHVSSGDSVFKSREKLIIYFEPDSSVLTIEPGDMVLFKSHPTEIRNAGNPGEFNYKSYLALRKIYRQVYLNAEKWAVAEKANHLSPRIFAEKARQRLLSIYRKNNIEGEEFAILSALTLGYKEALDPETRQVFSTAGVMHILAVSGLHVGIIFLIINFLFGFLRRSKKGKLLFILTSMGILWLFALITGLSPSVLRATVMFCFLIIGQNLRRPTNIYNTLALSACILLFIDPNLIFEVGFQLSYAAVFGIVFFQPKINSWFSFNNRIARWAWALFSVSVAAQLTTLPLTFFYFNYFPSYFWIANFIAIPGALIFIFAGIAILLTSPVPAISSALASFTSFLVKVACAALDRIGCLPLATIRNIHLSGVQLFFLMVAVTTLMLFIVWKKRKYLFIMLSLLILVFSFNIAAKLRSLNRKEIIVYNSDDNLIHLISGFRNYVIYENESQLNSYDMNYIDNTIVTGHLKEPVFVKAGSPFCDNALFQEGTLISFSGKNLFIDKTGAGKSNRIKVDFLLTKNRPADCPDTSVTIISSNQYVTEFTGDKKFHALKKQGAFIFSF